MVDYNINLTIQNIWSIIRVVMDIGIMWIILYYTIKFVRNNNRTIQIFKGILIILLLNGLAKILGLTTVEYITSQIISWGFLAIIIIFQPEIRGALEKMGKTNAFSKMNTLLANEKEKLVEELYQATLALSASKTGALISIEQSQSLQDYIKTGININAAVSKELLSSIFMTTTPLHDGAVIIQGDKVACASAYFPPTSVNLSSRYGARHRAALGISEVTDALTIVVSEETSAISIAEKGSIFNVNDSQLKDYLRRVICNDQIEVNSETEKRNSLLIGDEPEMVIQNEEEAEKKTGLFNRKSNRTLGMKIPFNNREKLNNKNKVDTVKEDIIIEDDVIEIKDNTGGNK